MVVPRSAENLVTKLEMRKECLIKGPSDHSRDVDGGNMLNSFEYWDSNLNEVGDERLVSWGKTVETIIKRLQTRSLLLQI